jgi:hypothetical protein
MFGLTRSDLEVIYAGKTERRRRAKFQPFLLLLAATRPLFVISKNRDF